MMHTIHTIDLNQDSEDKKGEELKYTVKVINAGTHHGRFSDVNDTKRPACIRFCHTFYRIIFHSKVNFPVASQIVPISCLGTFSVAMV